MTLMKENSLRKTDAKGEFLYYKLQDFVWDEVFSDYILNPEASNFVWDYYWKLFGHLLSLK